MVGGATMLDVGIYVPWKHGPDIHTSSRLGDYDYLVSANYTKKWF